jgi:hypothetical protein
MAGNYIVMADILGSGGSPARPLMKAFRRIVKKANTRFRDDVLSPLTITLGDEFQGVLRSLGGCLRLVLWLEDQRLGAEVPFRMRYVLHLGKIETPLNPRYAHEMLGPGLSHARRRLEALKNESDRFVVETGGGARDEALNLAFRVHQDISDRWSPEDERVAALFVNLRDYRKVAVALGVNPSSAFRRRRTLRIGAYMNTKALIECLARM